MAENYCEKSSIVLRGSSSRTSGCSGIVKLYNGLEGRSCGFLSNVFLCRYHYFQEVRKEKCCFPLPGLCSKPVVDCPSRLFLVFDTINTQNISSKICTEHMQVADKHETITSHPLLKSPISRKVYVQQNI